MPHLQTITVQLPTYDEVLAEHAERLRYTGISGLQVSAHYQEQRVRAMPTNPFTYLFRRYELLAARATWSVVRRKQRGEDA